MFFPSFPRKRASRGPKLVRLPWTPAFTGVTIIGLWVGREPPRNPRPQRDLRRLARGAAGRGGTAHIVHPRSRRDIGAGRRKRLGEVGDGAVDPAAAAVPRRRAYPREQRPFCWRGDGRRR